MLEQQNIQRLIVLCINSVRSLGHMCNNEALNSHLSKKSSFVSEADGRDSLWRPGLEDSKSEDLTLKDGRGSRERGSHSATVPLISEPSGDSSKSETTGSKRHPLSFDSSQDSSHSDNVSRGGASQESGAKTPFTPSGSKDLPDMSAANELIGKLAEAIKNAPPPDTVYREIILHGPQRAVATDETPRDPSEPYSKILSDCIEQTSQSRSGYKVSEELVMVFALQKGNFFYVL